MAQAIANKIIDMLPQAAELYHQLIILVSPAGAGKTAALQEIHKRTKAPLLNINLELSRCMLELTERQRALQLSRLLSEIVSESKSDVVLLDNAEILFDVSLKQDPLRLLQNLSRNRTVVVAWSGSSDDSNIVYAKPGHPEYRRYPIKDYLVINQESST